MHFLAFLLLGLSELGTVSPELNPSERPVPLRCQPIRGKMIAEGPPLKEC